MLLVLLFALLPVFSAPGNASFDRTAISQYPLKAEKVDSFEIDLPLLEKRVHKLVSRERKKKKIAELAFHEELVILDRNHSLDMVQKGFFDHINPAGQDPTARANASGFSCKVKSHDGVFPLTCVS